MKRAVSSLLTIGDPHQGAVEPKHLQAYILMNMFSDLTDKQSEYRNMLIESCVVTDENITVTYKYEGMVKTPASIIITNGEKSISPNGELSFTAPVYNFEMDSYTIVFTFKKPLENAKDIVKGIKVIQYDIELLEEQAIIIPLQ